MVRVFVITLVLVVILGCNHDDDGDALCSDPIEVTGVASTGYIITMKEGDDPSLIATEYIETYGDKINVYISSANFFAAIMSDSVLSIVRCDSRVKFIEYDSAVTIP